MLDLITIGDCTFDTFIIINDKDTACTLNTEKKELCFRYADKICLDTIDQSVGGNAANVAVGVHRLGLRTAIVSELGDDINGVVIAQELEDAGVDTRFITMHKRKETRFSIVLNYHSERTILSYHAKRTYRLPKLPQSKWIYYTSLGKSFDRLQKQLLAHLAKHPQIQLAMNPGSYQIKKGIPHMRALLPKTDILFVNKEEAELLLGKKLSIPQMLVTLKKKGVGTVVITDSTNGAFVYDGTEGLMMLPYPITAKARTGAGDAFASGFLSARMYGKDVATCLQWGTANAGGVIQKVGAHRGLCTRHALKKIISSYPHNLPKTYLS